jgi:hypothetical protein
VRPSQLERVAFGAKRPLLIRYLARKPKQFQRVLNRLSAACNVLNYITPPAAEDVKVPSVKFNVGWLAVHGTHLRSAPILPG